MQALKRKIHPTWILTVMCIGFVAGAALAPVVRECALALLVAGVVVVAVSFSKCRAYMLGVAAIGGVMVGVWWGCFSLIDKTAFDSLIGKQAVVQGKIITDPEKFQRGGTSITLDELVVNGVRYKGVMRAVTLGEENFRREDIVEISGRLSQGQGKYVMSMYEASVGTVTRPENKLLDVRDSLNSSLRRVIDEPMSSLGIGFLLGQKSELPSDFEESLKIAGLTHVVVASGYNLTILVRFSRRRFAKISKYQAALWSALLIVGFIAMTGWSASMTRAGLVAGLSLLAWYCGRKSHPVTLLSFVAAITVLINPSFAWGDVGWMLSFAAFAGVMIIAPLAHAYFYDTNEKPGFLSQTLIETASAQLATLPITLAVFGKMSIVALLSNMLILPLVPLAMALSMVAALGAMFLPSLQAIIAWPAARLLEYMVWVVDWTAELPWAQISWQLPVWGVVVSFGLIIAACIYVKRVTGYKLREANLVE